MGLRGQRGCPSPCPSPFQKPEEPRGSGHPAGLGDLTWAPGLGAMAKAEKRWGPLSNSLAGGWEVSGLLA